MMQSSTEQEASISLERQVEAAEANGNTSAGNEKVTFRPHRRRNADAVILAAYSAAALLLCLIIRQTLTARYKGAAKLPPSDTIVGNLETTGPVEASDRAPAISPASGEADAEKEPYGFPNVTEPAARMKLFRMLCFLEKRSSKTIAKTREDLGAQVALFATRRAAPAATLPCGGGSNTPQASGCFTSLAVCSGGPEHFHQLLSAIVHAPDALLPAYLSETPRLFLLSLFADKRGIFAEKEAVPQNTRQIARQIETMVLRVAEWAKSPSGTDSPVGGLYPFLYADGFTGRMQKRF
ncbi:hypothetical protein Efla_003062 [Eimeria flavescens]